MKAFYDNRRKNLKHIQKLIQNKPQTLPEGCKVKLDTEVLKGGIDYNRKTENGNSGLKTIRMTLSLSNTNLGLETNQVQLF